MEDPDLGILQVGHDVGLPQAVQGDGGTAHARGLAGRLFGTHGQGPAQRAAVAIGVETVGGLAVRQLRIAAVGRLVDGDQGLAAGGGQQEGEGQGRGGLRHGRLRAFGSQETCPRWSGACALWPSVFRGLRPGWALGATRPPQGAAECGAWYSQCGRRQSAGSPSWGARRLRAAASAARPASRASQLRGAWAIEASQVQPPVRISSVATARSSQSMKTARASS